jgi:hypothetical protein
VKINYEKIKAIFHRRTSADLVCDSKPSDMIRCRGLHGHKIGAVGFGSDGLDVVDWMKS